MFYKDEKLAILIDGPNTYSASRALGFDVDYKLLRQEFLHRGRLLRISYYTVLHETGDDYSPMRPMLDWMNYNGFHVVTKPGKSFSNDDGPRHKGRISMNLAVEAFELTKSVDHIVLFSGDGEFTPLVELIKRSGVRTTVISTINSNPGFVADDLRRAADHYIDLDDLSETIQRPPRS